MSSEPAGVVVGRAVARSVSFSLAHELGERKHSAGSGSVPVKITRRPDR